MCTAWFGEANSSSTNSTVTTAPDSSALTGVLNRGCTAEIHFAAGSAPSRAEENISRDPAPCTEEPQEKNAKISSSSAMSWIQLGSWDRMYGTAPSGDAMAPAKPPLAGIDSSSAAITMNEATPPQISA